MNGARRLPAALGFVLTCLAALAWLFSAPVALAQEASRVPALTIVPSLSPRVAPVSPDGSVVVPRDRGTILDRLTDLSRAAPADSPYHRTTWLTYYGRPNIPVMGILGEYELDELTELLREEAAHFDRANGSLLGVKPAYHLVYGMATVAPGVDDSHLAFLSDEEVLAYVEAAADEDFAVILDIQVGALSPLKAMEVGFPFLEYDNVHLAVDPEFAVVHLGQRVPGNPIGYITAAQVNEIQAAMQAYMDEHNITGRRILLVHQFLDEMIVDKDQLDYDAAVELTISVDGWGGPWGKISKFNSFVDRDNKFTAFKLFYRWDDPLLTPEQALGVDGYDAETYIETTPNMVIYQ